MIAKALEPRSVDGLSPIARHDRHRSVLVVDFLLRPSLLAQRNPCAPHHRIIVPVIVELQFPLAGFTGGGVVDAGRQERFG